MNAYLVSHNGMGDNLYMIGALHYISKYYNTTYFLCKKKYYDNIKLFFEDTNIECLPFDESNEVKNIIRILHDKYNRYNDIFICGCHTSYLPSKITNSEFTNTILLPNTYSIDWDTINDFNYEFIHKFYRDISLNITYMFKYFHIPQTNESYELYKSISKYHIVFIQYKSSDGKHLNISNLIKDIDTHNKILICNDINLYDSNKYPEKHELAQKFVFNKLVYYFDTIKHADEIYIIDSCFIGMVLPLLKTGQLKTNKVRIILRDDVQNHDL